VAACAAGSRRCVLHQWAKNLLVFLPLLASHRIEEVALIRSAVLAFFAFGLCASSVYVLNDLMDLESDRHHPRKRLRAFASGLLSPQAGLWVCAALLLGALWLGWQIGPAFTVWLDIYLALTLLYTFLLKRKILVDALTLAALYTLRILAGGAAVGIWPGFWLLAFSLFLFLSLAFVKRYSEVAVQLSQGRHGTQGRDYLITDLPLVEMLGIVSGFAAVVVMALYINGTSISAALPEPGRHLAHRADPAVLDQPDVGQGAPRRDARRPVVFALSDGISLLLDRGLRRGDGGRLRAMVMQPVSSWGRLTHAPHDVVALADRSRAPAVVAASRRPALPFGNGRSYGDVCLNESGVLWATRDLDRFIAFDRATGRLECEAGVTLD
jgi:4-hydroxybenzoate polyprenyltransferase